MNELELTYKNTRLLPTDEKLSQMENFCKNDHHEVISIPTNPNKSSFVGGKSKSESCGNVNKNEKNLDKIKGYNSPKSKTTEKNYVNEVNETSNRNELSVNSINTVNDVKSKPNTKPKSYLKSEVYTSDNSSESCEDTSKNTKTKRIPKYIPEKILTKIPENQINYNGHTSNNSSEINYCNYNPPNTFNMTCLNQKRTRNDPSLLFYQNNINKKQNSGRSINEYQSTQNKVLGSQVDKALQNLSKTIVNTKDSKVNNTDTSNTKQTSKLLSTQSNLQSKTVVETTTNITNKSVNEETECKESKDNKANIPENETVKNKKILNIKRDTDKDLIVLIGKKIKENINNSESNKMDVDTNTDINMEPVTNIDENKKETLTDDEGNASNQQGSSKMINTNKYTSVPIPLYNKPINPTNQNQHQTADKPAAKPADRDKIIKIKPFNISRHSPNSKLVSGEETNKDIIPQVPLKGFINYNIRTY